MIFAVDHPLWDVWNQKKNQFLIECLDRTHKSTASRQKKYSEGIEDFEDDFLGWPRRRRSKKKKKNKVFTWVSVRNHKRSLVGKKSSPKV